MFKRFITGWLCIVGMVLYALLLGLQHGCRRIIGIPGTLRSEPVSTNTLTTRHRLKASHTAPKNQSTHTQTARHTSQRSLEPSTSRSARKLPYNIHAAHEATGSHRHTIERRTRSVHRAQEERREHELDADDDGGKRDERRTRERHGTKPVEDPIDDQPTSIHTTSSERNDASSGPRSSVAY